jgi:hypothetical protein
MVETSPSSGRERSLEHFPLTHSIFSAYPYQRYAAAQLRDHFISAENIPQRNRRRKPLHRLALRGKKDASFRNPLRI